MEKNEILELSEQYRKEHRYVREKSLIEHANNLFPDWAYALERLDWHARPIFHADPDKSQVQPRIPVYQDREEEKPPRPETLTKLCIVTGMSSNAPYWELGVQLIESIHATRFYHKTPIKILDCGLTLEHCEYLNKRFQVEIKDPGWDINPDFLVESTCYQVLPQNGWKGCTARPYLHRHFPGFDYYLWIDADTWIQDETGLDHLIQHAEQQECGFLSESILCRSSNFINVLLKEDRNKFLDKEIWPNGIFCASRKFMDCYAQNSDSHISKVKKYLWGFDMMMFTCAIYQSIENPKSVYSYRDLRESGGPEPIVILEGEYKFSRYHTVDLGHLRCALIPLIRVNPLEAEDVIACYAKKYNLKTKSPFFREFPA
ncbi:MAG: hypothetical protein WCK49_10130 [Myxococcaceae bacterium]